MCKPAHTTRRWTCLRAARPGAKRNSRIASEKRKKSHAKRLPPTKVCKKSCRECGAAQRRCGLDVLENRSRLTQSRTASFEKVRRLRAPAFRCEARQPSPCSPVHRGRTG